MSGIGSGGLGSIGALLLTLGVDSWLDPDEMNRYYELGLGFEQFASVFDGQPDTSVWQSAPGEWAEW